MGGEVRKQGVGGWGVGVFAWFENRREPATKSGKRRWMVAGQSD